MKTPPTCPITSTWVGIFARGEQETADALLPHVQTCQSCCDEIQRLTELYQFRPRKSSFRVALENIAVGYVLAAFLKSVYPPQDKK